MKKLLMILVAVSPIISIGQSLPIDSETGEVVFTDVVSVTDSSTKAIDLFYRAQEFLVDVFVSADNVIEYENAETGKIIVKGRFKLKPTMVMAGTVDFRMDIQVKDGRYKYTIKDLDHKCCVGNTSPANGGNIKDERPDCGTFRFTMKGWRQVKDATVSEVNTLVLLLKNKMDITSVESEEDDW